MKKSASVGSLVLATLALFLVVATPATAGFDRSFRLSDPYDFFRPPRTRPETTDRHNMPLKPCQQRGGVVEYPLRGGDPRLMAHATKQELLLSNDSNNTSSSNATMLPNPAPATSCAHGRSKMTMSAAATTKEEVTPFVPKFRGAAWMAFFNIMLFALRPDPDVTWPTRVPRIVWEVVVYWSLCRAPRNNTSSPFLLWLAFLTGSTGLVDLFIWAPIYGAFVNFSTCEGGWLQPKTCRLDPLKGYSRLAVSVQSVLGGLVYLNAALQAMHALYEKRAARQKQQQLQQQQLMMAQLAASPPHHHRGHGRFVPHDPRDPPYRYRR